MRLQGRIAFSSMLFGLAAINTLADYPWWTHVTIILGFLGYNNEIQPLTIINELTKVGGPSIFLTISLVSIMLCFEPLMYFYYKGKPRAKWTISVENMLDRVTDLFGCVTVTIWIAIIAGTVLELVLFKVINTAVINPIPTFTPLPPH